MDLSIFGSDIDALKNLYPFYLDSRDYEAIVIYPLCPGNSSWILQASKIKGLIEYSVKEYNVDENKVALTGFSSGGNGVWEIGLKYTKLFSCLVPVSPFTHKYADVYPNCPVWAIGSTIDYSAGHVEEIGRVLGKLGKQVKVDTYDVKHADMPDLVYTRTLINWMIERSRETNSSFKF